MITIVCFFELSGFCRSPGPWNEKSLESLEPRYRTQGKMHFNSGIIPHLQLQLRHLLLLAYADVFWPSLANLVSSLWLFQPVVEILRWRCWGLLCCEMSSLFCFRAPKTPKTCRNLFKNRLIVQPNRFERKKTFGKWQQSLEFFWKLSCLLPKVNWSRSRSVLHDFTFCRRGFDCLLVASAPSFVPSSPNNEILCSHSTVQCQRSASGFVPSSRNEILCSHFKVHHPPQQYSGGKPSESQGFPERTGKKVSFW